MEINIKEFSEKLGTEPKKFRKFLRSGKLTQAKKENGIWNFNIENLADPFEYIKNLMHSRTRISKGTSVRAKKEKKEKVFLIPEYLTDGKPHWYGLKVDGGRELEVKESLEFLKINNLLEIFVPTQTVIKAGIKRIQNILTKIVFIRTAHITDISSVAKHSNSKVRGFWMSMPIDSANNKVPALIDEETVNSLKELHGRVITDEEIHGFEVNKMVEVMSGPFKHTKGFIQAVNGNIISVEMEVFGRPLPMHISSSQLRIIVE